jgi:hypothetical protein
MLRMILICINPHTWIIPPGFPGGMTPSASVTELTHSCQ